MMFRPAQSLDTATAFIDALHSDVYDTLDLMGAQVADAWRQKIGIPVAYSVGPRGGVVAERSKPGEPPRKETGNLQDSIESHVDADAQILTLDVDSDVPYAAYLDEGTGTIAPRPHVEVVFDEMLDQVFDAVIQTVGRG